MYRTKMILAGIVLALAVQNASTAEGVPDEMPFNIPYGATISVETAKIAVEAAATEAARRGWNLAIAVVSPAGDLDLSRFDSGSATHLSGLLFEGQGAFTSQS